MEYRSPMKSRIETGEIRNRSLRLDKWKSSCFPFLTITDRRRPMVTRLREPRKPISIFFSADRLPLEYPSECDTFNSDLSTNIEQENFPLTSEPIFFFQNGRKDERMIEREREGDVETIFRFRGGKSIWFLLQPMRFDE